MAQQPLQLSTGKPAGRAGAREIVMSLKDRLFGKGAKGRHRRVTHIGLTDSDLLAIKSLRGSVASFARAFEFHEKADFGTVDIVLVNADEPKNLRAWEKCRAAHAEVRALMVSRSGDQLDGQPGVRRPLNLRNIEAALDVLDGKAPAEPKPGKKPVASEDIPYLQPGKAAGGAGKSAQANKAAPGKTIEDDEPFIMPGKSIAKAKKAIVTKFEFSVDMAMPTGVASDTMRILVVEPNAGVRKALTAQINAISSFKNKTVVDFAEDEDDAYGMALQGNYDMLFLNIGISGQRAFETCKRIREQLKSIRIVIQSEKLVSRDYLLGRESGCNHYITTPIVEDDLRNIIALTEMRKKANTRTETPESEKPLFKV